MTNEQFLDLCKLSESATLDFKAEAYRVSEDWSQAALLKDILAMANTPRSEPAFIVLGVKKLPDGSFDLNGIGKQIDGNDLQSIFVDRVHPIPSFSYKPIAIDSKQFGVIAIPPDRKGPCVLRNDFKSFLKQRQVFLRRDSTNDIALPEDLVRIVSWISGNEPKPVDSGSNGEEWDAFLASVHNFQSLRQYILVSAGLGTGEGEPFASLGKIPWAAVFDFDPDSDANGLLKSVRPVLETHRTIQMVAHSERPTINSNRGTYWHFARGLTGRDRSVEAGPWLNWQRKYGSEISEQLNRLAIAINPSPVTFVIFAKDPSLLQHLSSLLTAAVGAFGESADFVVATKDPAAVAGTVAPYEAKVIQISLLQLSSGIENKYGLSAETDRDRCVLPSSSGAPVSLDKKQRLWIEEEIEIVHLNVGIRRADGRNTGYEFLRGAEIDWFELGLNTDVSRDISIKVRAQIRDELAKRRTARINLYHGPGAGGTTVARRMLWDFHYEYPCAILRRTEPMETVQRLSSITSLCEKGLLLMVDGSEIAEREIDELSDLLRGQNVPVIVLQVLRRFTEQQNRQRSFYLPGELTSQEAARFVEVFSHWAPSKRTQLEVVCSPANKKLCTPFYFGLETFGEDFLGLDGYVSKRIESLSSVQKKILGFLALSHHYAQKPIPAQAFASLIGITKSKVVRLDSVFPPETVELLIEAEKGVWRTVHNLIAIELLEQMLWTSGSDRRLWKQNLSTWATDFAIFCRGDDPLPSEAMIEVARRTFIYRDNSELLGTEKSASQSFSQLMEDIPVLEGALGVHQKLVELFPSEAHFWAHLGRFYTVKMRDYKNGLECIDRALALQDDDHVLHHVRGMALRYRIYSELENGCPLGDAVALTKECCAAFQRARELKPDNQHGYISEVQLLTRLIDYAGQKVSGGPLAYIASPAADPYLRDCLEHAEDLLEQVRRHREAEGDSPFEKDCRAKLDSLYGKHDAALQKWDSLLSRSDVYSPPVRRQIVWTYLARKNRSWDALSEKEIHRIVDLLEENLRQEPNHDRNLRLWVQAIRRTASPPSIDSVIEKVAYWKASAPNSLDAVYYLYVFHALKAIEGSQLSRDTSMRFLEECKGMAKYRRNRTKSLEWLGPGTGLKRLIHQSLLGEWKKDIEFWENPGILARVPGRISKISEPQSGQIEIQGGLNAFFVPARGNYFRGHSENQPVSFYLGFSYDGLRAWEVQDA